MSRDAFETRFGRMPSRLSALAPAPKTRTTGARLVHDAMADLFVLGTCLAGHRIEPIPLP